MDLVELNIPHTFVQAVLKVAVQVVGALVGGHMPVRAVDGDRGASGAVCHRADGRAKAGGVVKVILELIEAQRHIAHVAGNVGHIDTKHRGTGVPHGAVPKSSEVIIWFLTSRYFRQTVARTGEIITTPH